MSETQKLDVSWRQGVFGLQNLKPCLSCQADAKAMATPADSKQEVKPVKAHRCASREIAECVHPALPQPRPGRSQIVSSGVVSIGGLEASD